MVRASQYLCEQPRRKLWSELAVFLQQETLLLLLHILWPILHEDTGHLTLGTSVDITTITTRSQQTAASTWICLPSVRASLSD